MKILTTLFDIKHIEDLKHADGFILGNDAFGTRLTHSFNQSEINQAIISFHC